MATSATRKRSLKPGKMMLLTFPLLIAMCFFALKVSLRTNVVNGFSEGLDYMIATAGVSSFNATAVATSINNDFTTFSAAIGGSITSTRTASDKTNVPQGTAGGTNANHISSSNNNSASIHDPNQTFSACLLVMDDNFRLREWLAYNYHVLPLRHLVIANDKRSKLSPTPILDTFRNELGMDIVEWTDDNFMTLPDLDENATAHATRERYLIRQRRFLEKCVEHHYHAGHKWTACYDTDEAITISPQSEGVSFQQVTGRSSFEQPGAVLDYIYKSQAVGLNVTNIRDYYCQIIPRLLFGSVEVKENMLREAIPEGLDIDPLRLDTLRWRKHNRVEEKRNGLGKPLIDVSQMGPHLPALVRNPHRMIDQLCGPPFHRYTKFNGLRINHYLGSWEQYSFRDDSRKGADRSREVRCL